MPLKLLLLNSKASPSTVILSKLSLTNLSLKNARRRFTQPKSTNLWSHPRPGCLNYSIRVIWIRLVPGIIRSIRARITSSKVKYPRVFLKIGLYKSDSFITKPLAIKVTETRSQPSMVWNKSLSTGRGQVPSSKITLSMERKGSSWVASRADKSKSKE